MIYVFLAEGFEEIEALTTVDILRRANITVATVGIDNLVVTGSHGIDVTADVIDINITVDNVKGIILPGGMPGTLNLGKSSIVKTFINYCIGNNKYIAAICAAPSILGNMGYLDGKKAVCYPEVKSQLVGATYTDSPVVTDNNIITAKGAGVAVEFALEIVKAYKGEQVKNKIKDSLQCR